jgi:hypothetical protein
MDAMEPDLHHDGIRHPAKWLRDDHPPPGHAVSSVESRPAHPAAYINTRSIMKRKYLFFCVLCVGTVLGVGSCISDLLFDIAPLLL